VRLEPELGFDGCSEVLIAVLGYTTAHNIYYVKLSMWLFMGLAPWAHFPNRHLLPRASHSSTLYARYQHARDFP
jgi:hypothetical protein